MPPTSTPARRPRQLGMRRADPARLARTIELRFTGAVPPHPASADHLSRVPRWCLGQNTRFGTCGPVSVANSVIMTYASLLGERVAVSDEAVFDLYRRSGNPSFNPATGAGDNGVDMTVMLSALVKGGITITHADGANEVVVPLCFAKHPAGIDTVQAVTAIFGGDLFGWDLKVAQQGQTDAHPPLWDYVAGSGEWGGHATLGGAYTGSAAARTADELTVTWAQVVGTTDTMVARQLQEAYVVVWPALWTHPAFMAGVDQGALAAGYQAVTGLPFPVPVPPSPAPPSPAPPPPGAITADAADRTLAAAIHRSHVPPQALSTWLTAKHLTGGR